MVQAGVNYSINMSPDPCEQSLRLQLGRFGMRLQRRGYGYRLLSGSQVLLDRGPAGYGLSLQ